MHSAIIWTNMKLSKDKSVRITFLGDLGSCDESGLGDINTQKGVRRLAENVWQVTFAENPGALARIVHAAEIRQVPYEILPLVEKPQWLPADPSPTPKQGHSEDSSKTS